MTPWGVEVKAGESHKVTPEFGKYVRITQATLGDPRYYSREANNNVVLKIIEGDEEFHLGSLSNYKTSSALDLVCNREYELSHDLECGSVYFLGYIGVGEPYPSPCFYPSIAKAVVNKKKEDSSVLFQLPTANDASKAVINKKKEGNSDLFQLPTTDPSKAVLNNKKEDSPVLFQFPNIDASKAVINNKEENPVFFQFSAIDASKAVINKKKKEEEGNSDLFQWPITDASKAVVNKKDEDRSDLFQWPPTSASKAVVNKEEEDADLFQRPLTAAGSYRDDVKKDGDVIVTPINFGPSEKFFDAVAVDAKAGNQKKEDGDVVKKDDDDDDVIGFRLSGEMFSASAEGTGNKLDVDLDSPNDDSYVFV